MKIATIMFTTDVPKAIYDFGTKSNMQFQQIAFRLNMIEVAKCCPALNKNNAYVMSLF